MKCVILSRSRNAYSTKRLVEEGRKLNMKVRIIDTLKLSLLLNNTSSGFLWKNIPFKEPDVVIPRIGVSITSFGGCIMFQLEQLKIPMTNSSEGLFNSRDKLRCIQILSTQGLPVPATLMLRRPSQKELKESDPALRKQLFKLRVQQAMALLHGPPVVVKLNKGTQGIGVTLIKDINSVYSMVDEKWKMKQDFIIQEFIKESSGTDIRALVVNGKVVASMKRENTTGDFRSNTHQGGEVTGITLGHEEKEIAIKAAKTVGLSVCGVDMLISKMGPKIIEINSSPGFEGLEKATGINVAEHIMKFAEELGIARKLFKNMIITPQQLSL